MPRPTLLKFEVHKQQKKKKKNSDSTYLCSFFNQARFLQSFKYMMHPPGGSPRWRVSSTTTFKNVSFLLPGELPAVVDMQRSVRRWLEHTRTEKQDGNEGRRIDWKGARDPVEVTNSLTSDPHGWTPASKSSRLALNSYSEAVN